MHRSLFVTAVLAGTPAFAAAAETNTCNLVRIDTLTLRPQLRSLVVDGEIKGQRIGILLDTGAYRSLIDRRAAERLELQVTRRPGYRWSAGAGADASVGVALIEELKMGQGSRKDLAVLIAAGDLDGDIALILGHDFFEAVDFEFDVANGKVNLFRALNCGASNLAYWAKGSVGVVRTEDPMTSVTVHLNGQPLRAMLDTGSSASLLLTPTALRFGATVKSPDAVAAGCVSGIGRRAFRTWTAPFATFAIGDELIRDPKIRFAPMYGWVETTTQMQLPDMILGIDFLRSHRVLVARSQGRMYLSYVGGTVFPTDAASDCPGGSARSSSP